MYKRGFTIVELIITIAIMGILLTVGVVSLTSTQANARDSQRKTNAEAIATAFESFYENSTRPSSGAVDSSFRYTYPATTDIATVEKLTTIIPDIDVQTLKTPTGGTFSLVAATTNATGTSVAPKPSASNDTYVYQPLLTSGQLCSTATETSACERFNLYYFQENTQTFEMIQSKHQ